ncbi:MAG: peptide deformylase [Patescibacteria group bacterium]|nr:peptide deformylase [Patescibacteria group bacterium]
MASLEITIYPNPILAKKAEAVGDVTPGIKELMPQMVFAMQENDGIGLAAPQVNVSKRIIVIQDGEEVKTYINPRIIHKSREKHLDEEGCLSLPGIFFDVRRPSSIEVEVQTPEGKLVKIKAEGLTARILQHEIDHLEGKLIINRIPFWRRWKLREQLQELKNYAIR